MFYASTSVELYACQQTPGHPALTHTVFTTVEHTTLIIGAVHNGQRAKRPQVPVLWFHAASLSQASGDVILPSVWLPSSRQSASASPLPC
jgi:hypothetical protein